MHSFLFKYTLTLNNEIYGIYYSDSNNAMLFPNGFNVEKTRDGTTFSTNVRTLKYNGIKMGYKFQTQNKPLQFPYLTFNSINLSNMESDFLICIDHDGTNYIVKLKTEATKKFHKFTFNQKNFYLTNRVKDLLGCSEC
jgi:hypothetical protein